jgi:FlaA1/EpsC-like NDP-sugar epimerase
MSRVAARTWQTLIDLAALSLALWLAFIIRFDGAPPLSLFLRLIFLWPTVVGIQFALLIAFGIHHFAWRYVGLREVTRILHAVVAGSVVLLLVRFIVGALLPVSAVLQHAVIPIGVVLIDFVLAFVSITGVRALRRILGERSELFRRRARAPAETPTLLIGAGQAGLLVAKEIAACPELGITPVGFVDDDPAKMGTHLYGIPVVGSTEDLERICAERGARQALITIANAPGAQIRRINELCESASIPVKIIPGLYEIVGGSVSLNRIRDVAIEDLLGREPVVLDLESISEVVRRKVVLVTGAGGSIGSELCRQICRFSPKQLLLVERAENNLFAIHRELIALHPQIEIIPLICDICDEVRLDRIFSRYAPNVVYHAAAHKHVPMMEWNPGEAIKNNVFGTRAVANVANQHAVEIFVQVSTDKAVNPTSIMGSSKRIAEMYLQTESVTARTRFVTVRLGNVLGSAGSVVQIFREQIANGGPVTVTHPDMQRYFMMIPEACQLILQAAALANGGEIFVLDMGSPVRIVDLAKDMIRLSGYEPDEEISVVFTGIRPGEKLYEELLLSDEHYDRTVHPKIVVGRIPSVSRERMDWALRLLNDAIDKDASELRRCIAAIIPEAKLDAMPEANAAGEPRLGVAPMGLKGPIPHAVS